MIKKLSHKFDIWIYKLFYKRWSKRIVEEPGYGLLLLLWLDRWLADNPPSEEVVEHVHAHFQEQLADQQRMEVAMVAFKTGKPAYGEVDESGKLTITQKEE